MSFPRVALGELLDPVNRSEALHPEAAYRLLGARWYAGGLFHRETKLGKDIKAKALNRVEEGDFVYNRLFAWKGSFATAPAAVHGGYVSNEFPCFRVRTSLLEERYLRLYVSFEPFWNAALELSSGGTPTSRNRLKEKDLLLLTIPLPSLTEQRRIAERVEALRAKIEEAHQLQTASNEQLIALRGAAARTIIGAHEPSAYASIEELADVRGGIQKSPHRRPGANPVRYLTVAHVQRDHISIDDPRFFEVTSDEFQRWRLVPGDVLVVEGNGSATQIGRTALFRGEIADCVHQNHVIRIRPNRDVLSPEFLNQYLNSPIGREAVQAQSHSTSGLQTLSVGRVKSLQVPRLSLPMQKTTCREIERVRSSYGPSCAASGNGRSFTGRAHTLHP